MVVPMSQISIIAYSIMLSSSSSSSSSTVDQLDAGHRPLMSNTLCKTNSNHKAESE